ncbi:hypothetical protein DY023_13435 [Microbacterium bovistercoris]|uniref:Dinucleotide-utilizing enzyme n=2 Tax=Microbacterium bovistercoris TaxID=2293570 RepID=A0A371NSG9_9MICO|nr:hypothetical protein DY023_13435 [Microbacterium bovistercoris]
MPYLLLVLLSLAAIGVGGWLSTRQIGAMTSALLDGTATGVEVYAGQSWVVLGAVVLGAGVVGLLLALALAAAKALVPQSPPEVVEAIDRSAEQEAPAADEADDAEVDDERPMAVDSPDEPVGAASAR